MGHAVGECPLGTFPLFKIGFQRQRLATGGVQRRRQFVNIARSVNQ
jgi:hypothetical protein